MEPLFGSMPHNVVSNFEYFDFYNIVGGCMQFRRDMVTGFLDQDFLKKTEGKVSKLPRPADSEGMQSGQIGDATESNPDFKAKEGRAEAPGESAADSHSLRQGNGVEAALAAFRELAELVVPSQADQAAPVLELRFGGVDTRTTLLLQGNKLQLRIDVTLHRFEVELLPQLRQFVEFPEAQGGWNMLSRKADGSQVVVRTIPLAMPLDDRTLLNAVLDAANEVSAWYESASCAIPMKRR